MNSRTPLYDRHVAQGARMAPFGGWDMPIQYAGILAEHAHTRTACALFDICHMGEFEVEGPTAAQDLDRLLTQGIASLQVGQCRYGYLLNDAGGVLDDLTCYRRATDRFYLVVNAGTCARDAAWIKSHLSPATVFRDVSAATAKLDVQGPRARVETERALGRVLPELKYFRFAEENWNGMPCLVSRTGYTGEWGYELYFPASEAVRLWDLLLANPAIQPVGLGARDTLRLEMGYPLYGHELNEDQSPVGAGRGQFIDQAKEFIGKARVMRDLADSAVPYLVGLQLESRRAARAGDAVQYAGRRVGTVTSGSVAPSLGVAVALAYVERPLAAPGQALAIAVKGGVLPARVVSLPFYKQGTARSGAGQAQPGPAA